MHKSLCRLSLMAVLGLGSLTSMALAQDATPPTPPSDSGHMGAHGRGMSSEEQLKHLTKTLNLTADQQAQIKPMLDSSHQQMQQIHQDQSLSQEDRMSKMKSIMDDTHSKIESVLTDEQKQKFEAMRPHGPMHGGPQ